MDPNETLVRILFLARHRTEGGDMTAEAWSAEADELAEAVDNLNGWIVRGGFLPNAWVARPAATA